MNTQEMINEAAGAVDMARDELVIALYLDGTGDIATAQEQVESAIGMLEQALHVLQHGRIDQ